MNIIISFILYLELIVPIKFAIAEGKQFSENYIIFDKRSSGNHQIRSSEQIKRREISLPLADTPVEKVNPLTEFELQHSKGLVLAEENSSSGGRNDTSPKVTTESERDNIDKGVASTVPSTGQSYPDKIQPTSEGTPKEQFTTEPDLTEKNSTENFNTTDENPTSNHPVPSGSSSSAPSPPITRFVDATTFKGGMNHWDFEGEWGKYDLKYFKGKNRPVPELQTSEDNVIFMSKMSSPVSLRKQFPPLVNATITLTFYIKSSSQGNVEMQGFISNSEGEKRIFDMTKQELTEHNYLWCTNKYVLGSYEEQFTVIVRLRSFFTQAIWAADAITVRGWDISGQGEMPDYKESSTSTQTTKMFTTEEKIDPDNVTTKNGFDQNNSTENNGNYDELNGGDNSSTPESWKDLAHIATAIWDAFYVFLALFCACLIALIILIVKQRCRDDPMPPAMATYSPILSTYQIGKPRDNPSYETDSV